MKKVYLFMPKHMPCGTKTKHSACLYRPVLQLFESCDRATSHLMETESGSGISWAKSLHLAPDR